MSVKNQDIRKKDISAPLKILEEKGLTGPMIHLAQALSETKAILAEEGNLVQLRTLVRPTEEWIEFSINRVKKNPT